MRKLALVLAAALAAFVVIAATQTDSLAELKQTVADLTAQVEAQEARLDYFERFQPIDTFQPIQGVGSTAELAAEVNKRVPLADGINIAVTDAKVVRGASDIRDYVEEYGDWIAPPADFKLVVVDVNIYNTPRVRGLIESGMCPWESRDTLATLYKIYCEKTMFWNIRIDGVDYPLASPLRSPGGLKTQHIKIDGVDYLLVSPTDLGIGVAEEGITANTSTLFFHVKAARPLEGLMTYAHPGNEDSHRYWKLKRPIRKRQ